MSLLVCCVSKHWGDSRVLWSWDSKAREEWELAEGGYYGLVWNMGNKEMKSQGTIRPEVSLSLTFMSIGDDIREIYMGSGMIINEKEKEPLKA